MTGGDISWSLHFFESPSYHFSLSCEVLGTFVSVPELAALTQLQKWLWGTISKRPVTFTLSRELA